MPFLSSYYVPFWGLVILLLTGAAAAAGNNNNNAEETTMVDNNNGPSSSFDDVDVKFLSRSTCLPRLLDPSEGLTWKQEGKRKGLVFGKMKESVTAGDMQTILNGYRDLESARIAKAKKRQQSYGKYDKEELVPFVIPNGTEDAHLRENFDTIHLFSNSSYYEYGNPEERTELEERGGSPVYGEILPSSIAKMFQRVVHWREYTEERNRENKKEKSEAGRKQRESSNGSSPAAFHPAEEEVFADFGSGTGRLSLAAFLGMPFFRRVVGVEFLTDRVTQSIEKLEEIIETMHHHPYKEDDNMYRDFEACLCPPGGNGRGGKMELTKWDSDATSGYKEFVVANDDAAAAVANTMISPGARLSCGGTNDGVKNNDGGTTEAGAASRSLTLHRADFLQRTQPEGGSSLLDLNNVTVLYMCSTLFDKKLMSRITKLATASPSVQMILTFKELRLLKNDNDETSGSDGKWIKKSFRQDRLLSEEWATRVGVWRLVEVLKVDTTWIDATSVYVYIREEWAGNPTAEEL